MTKIAVPKDFLKTNLFSGSYDFQFSSGKGILIKTGLAGYELEENPVALALTASGISVQHGYLLNTIEAGTDWACRCQINCGEIYIPAT